MPDGREYAYTSSTICDLEWPIARATLKDSSPDTRPNEPNVCLRLLRTYPEDRSPARSADPQSSRLVNHHASDGLTILFLLRRVDPMGSRIYRETMHARLHGKVLQFAEVRGVILLDNRNEAA